VCHQGERRGWFAEEFGLAIFTMANVGTFATLVWIGASSLRTSDDRRTLAQESLRQAHLELEVRVLLRTSELAAANADLQEQMLERARAEFHLRDASRRAGMAEVATSVLHNVGNILNSVNISATLAADGLRESRVGDLARVVGLLERHEADLGAFVSRDPQGTKLLAFLRDLSGRLHSERESAIAELSSLHDHIEHIKQIVAMQQSHAKISGVTEISTAGDLVEDSLGMNGDSLARHEVEVVREYGEMFPVSVEKHKVLQILVNLIRNAKHACDEGGAAGKRITVRIAKCGGSFRIAVTDNGIGVAPENLTRIFNFGFTTKNDGHGFGLHYGANTARELGGSLTAQSDGLGKGSVFTLELPLCASRAPRAEKSADTKSSAAGDSSLTP